MEKFVRKGHENVRFFVGPEIEQTPAFGKKTLFVVGLQDTSLVEKLAREHKTPHIFLSANRSFDSVEEVDPGVYMVGATLASDWEKQIHYLLDQGFMVSLDYPAHKHVMVLKILNAGIWQCRNFIPVLSVAIPHVNTSGPNLTIKIDDSNFGATNPGIWCMNHHEVTDSNRFTSWNEYHDDMILDVPVEYVSPALQKGQAKVGKIMNPHDVPDTTGLDIIPEGTAKILANSNTTPVISVTKNETEIGLDPFAKSSLKSENEEEKNSKGTVITSPQKAAEAYAEGAKEDPLGKTATKKTKVTKK
jgi:hypothetical protein